MCACMRPYNFKGDVSDRNIRAWQVGMHGHGRSTHASMSYNVKRKSCNIYALIKSVKLINSSADGIKYYKNFGSMEFVDLNQVKCVIGRIMDHGRWAIVDRSTSFA